MSEMRVAPIVTALLAKGFVKARKRDHQYFFFHYQGKKTSIYTKVSHGEKSADDWLLRKMAQQLRLTKQEFVALIECTLSAEQYAHLVVQRGHVQPA